jgi:hypothetical protein
MLWLTWRQHRWQVIGVVAVLVCYAGYLIYAGLSIRHALATCPSSFADGPVPDSCLKGMDVMNRVHSQMTDVVLFGNLLPLAVGMFWGAPLIARELEQGTYRLVFTQSVSRRRWLVTKLGALSGAAALLGAVTGAVVAWSYAAYADAGGFGDRPFGNTLTFSQSGVVPAATWVFALLTGVTVGLLLRRTMTAVAVTLVALPLVFLGLVFVRPHYLPPAEHVVDSAHMTPDSGAPISNSEQGWVFQVSYVDQNGRDLDSAAAGVVCADPGSTYPTAQCLDRTGLRQRIVYQPADRYVWFQLIEAGLLLGASGAMVLYLRRRIGGRLA